MTGQCEELIDTIKHRHAELLASIREQRTRKQLAFSDHLADCTQRLHRTTGLLQFGVEILKEPDPAAFLLVSNIPRHFARSFFAAQRTCIARRFLSACPSVTLVGYVEKFERMERRLIRPKLCRQRQRFGSRQPVLRIAL